MLRKKHLSWRRSAWKLWDFWLEGFSDNLRQQLESIWLLRSSLEGRKPSRWISSPCRGVRISPPIGGAVCSRCWEKQQSHKQQISSHPWKETPMNHHSPVPDFCKKKEIQIQIFIRRKILSKRIRIALTVMTYKVQKWMVCIIKPFLQALKTKQPALNFPRQE